MAIRTILIAAALMCASPAFAQSARLTLPDLSSLKSKASDLVDITIDSKSLKFISAFLDEEDDPALKALLDGAMQVQVRSYEFDSDFVYSQADVDAVLEQLSAPGWTPLVQVRNNEEQSRVNISIAREGDKVTGVALVVAEPRKLTILNAAGAVDLEKIAGLQQAYGLGFADADDER